MWGIPFLLQAYMIINLRGLFFRTFLLLYLIYGAWFPPESPSGWRAQWTQKIVSGLDKSKENNVY